MKPRSFCPICGTSFIDDQARDQHRRDAHGDFGSCRPASRRALLARALAAEARTQELEAENTTLRALVQCNQDWKCPYGQTVAHIAECPHGFPGCACADDRMAIMMTIMMSDGEAKP